MYKGVVTFGFLIFLGAACILDYRFDKIHNGLIAAGLLWSCIMQLYGNGLSGLGSWVTGALIVFLCTYPFFKIGVLGAGDVKLFAVSAGYLGIKSGMVFLGCTFLVAAVFAVFKMLYQRNFFQRFRYFFHYVKQICHTTQITLYEPDEVSRKKAILHLAGPAFLAGVLMIGGVY